MIHIVSLNREAAFEIYKEKNGKIKPKEIALILNEDSANIRKWKNNDRWDLKLGIKKSNKGAPKGNKNAVGNSGGGAPKGNLNGFKHGDRIPPERFNSKSFLSKYLPKATQKIMNDIHDSGLSSLDILWTNIEIHFTALIRSQKIMHVKNNKDMTKELKKKKEYNGDDFDTSEVEYEIQFAWDKQERFLKAQAIAMKTLTKMITEYEELLHKNWNLATEEQKLRVEKLKADINSIANKDNKDNEPIEILIKRKAED